MTIEFALIQDCFNGNIEKVNERLQIEHLTLGPPCNYGFQALMSAAENGHDDVLQKLLDDDRIQNANLTDATGKGILVAAIQKGHTQAVKTLLSCEKVDAEPQSSLSSPLNYAAFFGHTEILSLLLNKGLDANETNKHGKTALIQACSQGKIDTAQLLCVCHVDLNIQDNFGKTALMHAVENGHHKIVQELLKYKDTTPKEPDAEGLSPHDEIDLNLTDAQGNTALMLATMKMDTQSIEMLLEKLPTDCRLSDQWLSRRDNGMDDFKERQYRDILTEIKRKRKITFKGVVCGIILLRNKWIKAAETVYAPEGAGFHKAQESFAREANTLHIKSVNRSMQNRFFLRGQPSDRPIKRAKLDDIERMKSPQTFY